MTEKDKMLAGELYDANFNPELIEERLACKELCYDYNHLRPRQTAERDALMLIVIGSFMV